MRNKRILSWALVVGLMLAGGSAQGQKTRVLDSTPELRPVIVQGALDVEVTKFAVALKILPADVAADRNRMSRFVQEAKAASALNHPNILTIHEIDETDSVTFITTEFIDGETLRQHMQSAPMKLGEVLDVAAQIAGALSAAHSAGIIHRDIKPGNIMLRRDGIVKVLDFGLAKLTERLPPDSVDTEAATKALVQTEPGLVLGTVAYMSPEQARGTTVDARTDIFSLGVVVYEMMAGCLPFAGATTSELLAAILNEKEPPPLARFARDVPDELERIVEKALRKDREERYQTSKDVLLDLRRLKHKLEVDAEIERTVPPEGGTPNTETVQAQVTRPATVSTTSSAEYIVNQVKLHKRGAVVTLAVLLLATAVTLFFYFRHARAAPDLTDKDTILLVDFDNKTGDAIFDGTLKQGLAVQLGQSPFLSVFPDARVRETLRLMNRSPDERVTPEIGREICERQGLKAYIAGSLAPLGSHYVLTLEAVNGHTGDVMQREQVEAESKEQVLQALSKAAIQLREHLGESLDSIQKFDTPLQVTTSSLEAFKAWALGFEQSNRGNFLESIPLFKRAIEIDPNFASAYLSLAVRYQNIDQRTLAVENIAKAYALREHVTEREKIGISFFYYANAREDDKAIELLGIGETDVPTRLCCAN